MKHIIIGTAGHVDHGKTCLIKALTGIDTDRLKEEKKRGITIENGFAYLDLPTGQRVGIIDVPGHEKFVSNMLAGIGGIDLAMLVIAADEGVMPQTREHLNILKLLNMKNGIIVVTKSDLVEKDFLDLVCDDIKENVADTFLEDAAILPVSAFTGEGIDELIKTITHKVECIEEKDLHKPFRIPIDRVFTLTGFGTVVTGTLIEGSIKQNQEAMLYPSLERIKIRSIQVHSQNVTKAYAGQRVAVNLSNLKVNEINRGDVLAASDSMQLTRMLDVKLSILKDSIRNIKNNSWVHFYHGSRELIGKVILFGQEQLEPGESCYAQIRLEEEIAVKKGDYYIIRYFSPLETVGGGYIIDPIPLKHKRSQSDIREQMKIKENGTKLEQLELMIDEYSGYYKSLQWLIKYKGLDKTYVSKDFETLLKSKRIREITDDIYINSVETKRLQNEIVSFMQDFHNKYPLQEGMNPEEFRSRIMRNFDTEIADGIINYFVKEKLIKKINNNISLYNFKVEHKESDSELMENIINIYREAVFNLPNSSVLLKEFNNEREYKQMFSLLFRKKILLRLDEQFCIYYEYYEKAQQLLKELMTERNIIILGEYRDILNTSRKVAVALLEYFDHSGLTVKSGEGRILKGK